MIKSKRPFTMQARVEVEILELLRQKDPEGKYNCGKDVRTVLAQFAVRQHYCRCFR